MTYYYGLVDRLLGWLQNAITLYFWALKYLKLIFLMFGKLKESTVSGHIYGLVDRLLG